MKYLLVIFLLLGLPVQAQTVTVKTGEHGDFTRLVLTYPAPVDWVLGRSEGGYGLRIAGPGRPYDLSSVYRPITRDRLRSIWVDPATGDLLLGVDCACHAIPFELGARVLVIDIKDGVPPENSSFELNLADGVASPPLQTAQPQRPRRNTRRDTEYTWLAKLPEVGERPDPASATLGAELRLEDFRSMLIDEVGRGASQGVVQLDLARQAQAAEPAPEHRPPENARAAIDSLPGIQISADQAIQPDLMVQGELCPQPGALDDKSWTGMEDAATELARTRAAVLSEFDQPDPELVIQAANTHLHFGLGAEARLLLKSFLPRGRSDALRTGISYLVDGETPPDNPFRNMQSCDSAVALWALLAATEGEAQSFINGAAVSRTFLALPATLRTSLGPETARRLLSSGDSANAEVVRQSFQRAAPKGDPSINLLTATQALQTGDPAGAEIALPQNATGEAALASLLTLIEARFQQRKPVGGQDILALEAFAFEHGNGPLRPKLNRALSHANALGGNFDAAFDHSGHDPALAQDIWMLLAETGSNSPLLSFAVGLDPVRRGALPLAIRSKIAERLVAAGLPNAAADWAQTGDLGAELSARVALANGDPRSALRFLANRMPDADPDLLAASYTAAGDFAAAASIYQAVGNTAEAARLQRWANDWAAPPPSSDPQPDDSWATVAGIVVAPQVAEPAAPPLSAGQARLDQSANTRQAIANLLAAAPVP